MCTLIAFHRCDEAYPLAIAANRDEWLDRPSEGIAIRQLETRRVLAPRDLKAGGTWLGVNDCGVFAAVTNRPGPQDPTRRSRGLLVLEVLEARSAREATDRLHALPERAFNGFNLYVADGCDAAMVVYDGVAKIEPCSPGVHLIGNVDPNDRLDPKVRRLMARAERVAAWPSDAWLGGLAEVCRGHDGAPPYGAACVHADGYGTKSSTLLRLGKSGEGQLRHASGAPCEEPYEDLTPQLDALGIEMRATVRIS